MSEATVRRAAPADFGPIVVMCKTSLVATYGAFLDEEAMRPWSEGPETDKYVRAQLSTTFVADDGGRIVGVVCLEGDMVGLLWVDMDRRGEGIGSALMAAADRALTEAGHEAARVECFAPNTRALRFYSGLGWREVDRVPDEPAGVDKVLLRKTLTQ